jgi:chromosomal replication initiation ATPase DnaA
MTRLPHIIEATAALYGVTPDHLTGPDRTRGIAQARQAAFSAAHQEGHSIAAIGRAFNRDHTTVMHGLSRVKASPELSETAYAISERAKALDVDWVAAIPFRHTSHD